MTEHDPDNIARLARIHAFKMQEAGLLRTASVLGDCAKEITRLRTELDEERERCAAIAEHPNAGLVPPDGGSPDPREMCANIAAAIRSR